MAIASCRLPGASVRSVWLTSDSLISRVLPLVLVGYRDTVQTQSVIGGHVVNGVASLGIPRRTLYHMTARYGISPEPFLTTVCHGRGD